jgi:transcription initiation factor TFIIIB Brf1 subunit/transcription initiation factor TFIIB
MPTWKHPDGGYRSWWDGKDFSTVLEFGGTAGEWVCSRCGAIVSERPPQSFEARATSHVNSHKTTKRSE